MLILLIQFINWKYTSECTIISSAFTLHDQGKKVYHIWTKGPIPYTQINYALSCVKCFIFSPFTLIPLLIYNLADFRLHHHRFSRLNQETTAANEFTCLQVLQVFRSSLKIHMCKDFPKWRGLRIWRSRQNSQSFWRHFDDTCIAIMNETAIFIFEDRFDVYANIFHGWVDLHMVRAKYEFGVDFWAWKSVFTFNGTAVYGCHLERDAIVEAADWKGWIERELQGYKPSNFVRWRECGRTLAVRAGSRDANPDIMRLGNAKFSLGKQHQYMWYLFMQSPLTKYMSFYWCSKELAS